MRPVLLALFAIAASAQTFQVAGVVVEDATGRPMKGMRMSLVSADNRNPIQPVVTGQDGKFSFDVPQGKYRLSAQHRGIQAIYGRARPTSSLGSAIIAGPGLDVAHLVFRWFVPGAIVGTVTDGGEPVTGALVQLIRTGVILGRKRTGSSGWVYTDDRGQYRIAPVLAGTYYIAISGAPWYSSLLDSQSRPTPAPSPAYATVYYPSSPDLAGAAPIEVRQGDESRADVRLTTVPGVTIKVNCPESRGRTGVLSLVAERTNGMLEFQRQISFSGPSQTIPGIAPGRYTLVLAITGDNPFTARKTVDVSGVDLALDLAVLRNPTVTGRVTLKSGGRVPGSMLIGMALEPAGPVALARPIQPDGSFAIPNVPAGTYRPQLGGVSGFIVTDISVEGATVSDGVLSITEGESARLNLVASDETGRIRGFVENGDRRVPAALVALVPTQESANGYLYHGFQTESDGSFDFQNVPSGEYVLFAVADPDFEYATPEVVKPYMGTGKLLRLEPHQTYDERIGLTELKR